MHNHKYILISNPDIISVEFVVYFMVIQTKTRLFRVMGKSKNRITARHTIFLEKAFVEDSLFPFKAGDVLLVRIDPDNDRLIITKDNSGSINTTNKDKPPSSYKQKSYK
jgi:hypothetical protein